MKEKIKLNTSLAVSFAIALTVTSASVHAQQPGQPTAGVPLSARQAALDSKGFNVDWNCSGSSGRSHLSFREEGEKIVVDINNFGRGTCKSEAKITDSSFTFDGCRDTGIIMSFDPSNIEIPFKAQSPRCSYEFKAR